MRHYTAVFKNIAVTAVQDLFEITAPTDSIVVIKRWSVTQSTETGDAAEEMLVLTCNRGTALTTSGSGGAAVTPAAVDIGTPAFGGVVERNNTTVLAVGTGVLTELEVYAWNIRIPMEKVYDEQSRPVIGPGNRWTLELETVPIDSITISGTIEFYEMG